MSVSSLFAAVVDQFTGPGPDPGEVPDDLLVAHGRGAVGEVLGEDDVTDPVQLVLDAPVWESGVTCDLSGSASRSSSTIRKRAPLHGELPLLSHSYSL